ncbi:MAG: 3-hydroxybutyryl-CoA dehydrogenase [Holophagaceae bacterium]|nr:3-hydroxybutyryl-CoA dehydrogenase [Holophagaceae bacterium]
MTGILAILGPGVLGRSAAQWAAECGLEVRLLGRDKAHAGRGRQEILKRWGEGIAQGRLTAHAFEAASLEGVDYLLEALPEHAEAKATALASAGRWGSPDLTILSGTSSLPISALAQHSGLTGRLLGFHLFVPVPRMAVVEMAVAPDTGTRWVTRARALGQALGKRIIQVRDQPGFAASRMALAQGLEAMRLLEAGVASAEDLDALMTLGYGHPVGPLELSDRVGLDLRLLIAEGLSAAGEARFQPPESLRTLVAEGSTGRKARRGFHTWDLRGRRT